MGLMWRRYNQAPIRIPRGITSLHLLMRMVVFLPINWMINCLLCFHFFPKLCYKVADLCSLNFILQWKLYPSGFIIDIFPKSAGFSSFFGFQKTKGKEVCWYCHLVDSKFLVWLKQMVDTLPMGRLGSHLHFFCCSNNFFFVRKSETYTAFNLCSS